MHADRARPVRVGLSGWNYAHWRNGVFYPAGLPASRWLDFYARRFDTVEVNSTFYRLPRVDAVANWVEQTPPGFLFAVKAFCTVCGSSLFGHQWPDGDEISVRLGALDDSSTIAPSYHSWVGSKAEWDTLPADGLTRYEEGPPSY